MKLGTHALIGVVIGAASTAWAAPQLVVTEIWAGIQGDDVTADWFEITNFGDMAWDLIADPLWYDDSSADPVDAATAPISNINSIAPNESVVVLVGAVGDVGEFFTAWDDSGQLAGVQIGWSDGAGLGNAGPDGVNIFDDLVGLGNIVASQGYPNPEDGLLLGSTFVYDPVAMAWQDDKAMHGVFGAWTAPGGPAGDDMLDHVGSPGLVPEPASICLLAIGALSLVRRRN